MSDEPRIKVFWDTDGLNKVMITVQAEAYRRGARAVTAQAIRNVRKHKLKKPGGYHKTPGAMARQIKTGPTKALGKPAGSVLLHWPGLPAEFGTKRSKPLHFLKKAVETKKDVVLKAVRNTI